MKTLARHQTPETISASTTAGERSRPFRAPGCPSGSPHVWRAALRRWATRVATLAALGAAGLSAGFAQGVVDPAFTPSIVSYVGTVAVQPDGKILLAGDFTAADGVTPSHILRLGEAGALDPAFTPAAEIASRSIVNLAVQADGKIVVAGGDGVSGGLLVRLAPDGTLDPGFNAVVNDQIHCIAVQPDGKILIGGMFTMVNGVTRHRLARLLGDGSLDPDFDGNANSVVESIAVQPDGKIVIGGAFFAVGNVERDGVARLLPADGALDPDFAPVNAGPWVRCVALQADGKILIGGDFNRVNLVPRLHLARLEADGSLDVSFNPVVNEDLTITPVFVSSLALQVDGKIVAGGRFTSVGENSTARHYVARFLSDGTVDPTFDPDADATVFGLALQADGKVLLVGGFTSVGGTPRTHVARLLNDPATEALTAADATRVEWLRGGAAPETTQVAFDLSTDGATWAPLGAGTRIPGGWELTGLSLPQFGLIRAQARVMSGVVNGSTGLVGAYVLHDVMAAALQQVAGLIDQVRGLAIHQGTKNSLLAKLDAARRSLQRHNMAACRGSLEAFLNEVRAQRGKKLTTAEADQLAAAVRQILEMIGP